MGGTDMRILILEMGESEESILQDIFSLLSGKAKFQFMELAGSAESCKNLEASILTFSDLEIHVREQAVYKGGILVPMSHYEFFYSPLPGKTPWLGIQQTADI